MKKFLIMLLAAVMIFSFSACGGGSEESTSESASDDGSMKVAMITYSGDVTDQSFNQTTYEACKAYCEQNSIEFTYKKPATDTDADREASIEEAIEEGYNVLVMPSSFFGTALYDEVPLYPDIKFIGIDISENDLTNYGEKEFNASDYSNLYGCVYQEEYVGYMAGYAAVKMGYKKIGFLGGMAVPGVQRYGYGYIQGADAAAEEMGASDIELKYVYGGQFFGDADITAAMDTWYSMGTEVVFACGGGIYTSAAEAAAKVDGKIIGVDVDQLHVIDDAYGEGMTITSAMKGLETSVNMLLEAIQNDKWTDYAGQFQTLGIISENSAENFVKLSDSTVWTDSFTEDDYNTLVKEFFNGARTVSNDTETFPETKTIKVDNQGSVKG